MFQRSQVEDQTVPRMRGDGQGHAPFLAGRRRGVHRPTVAVETDGSLFAMRS